MQRYSRIFLILRSLLYEGTFHSQDQWVRRFQITSKCTRHDTGPSQSRRRSPTRRHPQRLPINKRTLQDPLDRVCKLFRDPKPPGVQHRSLLPPCPHRIRELPQQRRRERSRSEGDDADVVPRQGAGHRTGHGADSAFARSVSNLT